MGNSFFRFQRFTVRHEHCAMKVGTDGTLLGAWANGGRNILDIGTGTGLIALMMAQRFPQAIVTAIDIDPAAAAEARDNVAASPFAERVRVEEADATTIASGSFDSIVCNPPFFIDSLTSPDSNRTLARHSGGGLTYAALIATARRLLADDGELSVVIPSECLRQMESEAALAGLFKSRECKVRTTPRKLPRRHLLAFRLHPSALERTEGTIEDGQGHRSPWYNELTKDFYL